MNAPVPAAGQADDHAANPSAGVHDAAAVPPTLPPDAAQATQAGSASEARIAHLFRTARRQGLIHPLQHLLQRHRGPQGGSGP